MHIDCIDDAEPAITHSVENVIMGDTTGMNAQSAWFINLVLEVLCTHVGYLDQHTRYLLVKKSWIPC